MGNVIKWGQPEPGFRASVNCPCGITVIIDDTMPPQGVQCRCGVLYLAAVMVVEEFEDDDTLTGVGADERP